MTGLAPPTAVLSAFGVRGPATPLAGGQGGSWLADDIVLKGDVDSAVQEWLGVHFGEIEQDAFRLAEPVRAIHREWTVGGWSATRFVTGTAPDHRRAPRWAEIVEAGRALHRAFARFPRPEFVRAADNWWAVADRAAWGERRTTFRPELDSIVARLRPALAPLGPNQLVHCDLTGNVLFAEGLPPAVIDLSLYWRPCQYAEGVVVADALCWHEGSSSLPGDLRVSTAAVARALLFRIATTQQRVNAGVKRDLLVAEVERYRRAASALGL